MKYSKRSRIGEFSFDISTIYLSAVPHAHKYIKLNIITQHTNIMFEDLVETDENIKKS